MKCLHCGTENSRTAKFCGQCGKILAMVKTGGAAASKAGGPAPRVPTPDVTTPFWKPDWRWHLKVLSIIYVVLIAVYFALNIFLSKVPEPYRMRDIPKEMTPWLKK